MHHASHPYAWRMCKRGAYTRGREERGRVQRGGTGRGQGAALLLAHTHKQHNYPQPVVKLVDKW